MDGGRFTIYSSPKIADLKTSNVKMYHIYFPETHQMEDITIFEKMADRLLKI